MNIWQSQYDSRIFTNAGSIFDLHNRACNNAGSMTGQKEIGLKICFVHVDPVGIDSDIFVGVNDIRHFI